jgi:uncharacterized protein (DUF1800 family)
MTRTALEKLDPDWAWAAYQPREQQPWDHTAAAHLFRRGGFGATWDELDQAVRKSPAEAVADLLAASREATIFDEQMEPLARVAATSDDPSAPASWWLYRMLHSPAQLREKLALFWHGHFATSNAKVRSASLMLAQNRTLRQHALGPFGALVRAVARDPAMLIYLDCQTNRRLLPNENFARELMELFCLGEGNYTEQDIQELARCFTGWEVHSRGFHINPDQHDPGEKNVLGQRGHWDGDDALRIVLEQPAVATFLACKLYRYFVADEPRPPARLIDPLARLLAEGDYRIDAVLPRILGSNLFFSAHARGRRVRSPVELAIGLLRSLGGTSSATELASGLRPLGQLPFYPPSVKGWDGGRSWINSTTLLGRANLVHRVLREQDDWLGGKSLSDQVAGHLPQDPDLLVDRLSTLLLAVPLADGPRRQLIEAAIEQRPSRSRQVARVLHLMSTLPEFQLA